MLSDYERFVYVFDFTLRPKHASAPNISMKECIDRLYNIYSSDKAVKMYLNDTRAMRVSDFQINNRSKKVTLLVQLCDKNATDPVFSELKNGSIRVEPKLEGEGIAISAHIIISLKPNDDAVDSYLSLVEDVPGIGRTALKIFLQSLLKDAFDGEEFKNPHTNRFCEQRPMLDIKSHQSKSLEDSLRGGRLLTVTLTSSKKINEFDQDPYTSQVEHLVKLKVVRQPKNLQEKINFITNIRNIAKKEGFDKLKVSFRNKDAQDSLEFERDDDASTKLFTKSERIILADAIGQCEAKIHSDLQSKMILLMKKV